MKTEMNMFASRLPLYIVTTLFAFGCVSALPSVHKQDRRFLPSVPKKHPEILPNVPEQDLPDVPKQHPEILRNVPEQDPESATPNYVYKKHPEILPNVPEQDPRFLPDVPKQHPEILRNVPEQDPESATPNYVSNGNCPPLWVQYNSYCYRLKLNVMSWDEAEAFCESVDGNLVTIDDNEENDFVLDLIQQYSVPRIWIGLRARLRWYDGSVPVYTNWDEGEPNGQATEPCGSMYGTFKAPGFWNDVPCEGVSSISTVCKKPSL